MMLTTYQARVGASLALARANQNLCSRPQFVIASRLQVLTADSDENPDALWADVRERVPHIAELRKFDVS